MDFPLHGLVTSLARRPSLGEVAEVRILRCYKSALGRLYATEGTGRDDRMS